MVRVFELWEHRVSTFPGPVEKTRIYPIAYGEINEAGLQFNHKVSCPPNREDMPMAVYACSKGGYHRGFFGLRLDPLPVDVAVGCALW
jgi:hypothetical protein